MPVLLSDTSFASLKFFAPSQVIVITETSGRKKRRYHLNGTGEPLVETTTLSSGEQAQGLSDAVKGRRSPFQCGSITASKPVL